jgi:hypothetical protein
MTKAPTPTFPSPTAPAASRAEVHLRYLDYFRAVLVAKLEGLSDRALPPEPNQRFVLRDQAVAAGAEATSDSRRAESDRSAPLGRAFRQGAIVQVVNPKVALFFLAFLPQFVDPAVGPSAAQIALLGAVFVVLALLADAMYALLAGTLVDWLRRSSSARRGLRRVSGAVYIGLGATAAVSGSRPSQ